MKELLDFAIQTAEQAGKITLKYFQSGVEVESKKDDSPVTIADRETEDFIRSEIEKRFPDDAILGEEFGGREGKTGFRWLLDPIDGTKSFICGVPLYGTMISLEKEGRPILGVIRFPPLQQTLAALEGNGCTINGNPCRVSETSELSESLLTMTSYGDLMRDWGEDILIRLIKKTGLHRTWGDCYGYLMVATGQADISLDTIVQIWDVAALIPIIQEAGGRITNLNNDTSIHMSNTIATNGILHDQVLNLIKPKG
ncbi:MAG: histidinol-phosphatase [Candidatus Omnitrophica bacterium]|nr:histidinol-phosphatase [Candidatus Omnitrophota bacterium]